MSSYHIDNRGSIKRRVLPVFGPFCTVIVAGYVKVRRHTFALQCQSRQPHSSCCAISRCLPAYCMTNFLAILETEWPATCDMASPIYDHFRWYQYVSFPRSS